MKFSTEELPQTTLLYLHMQLQNPNNHISLKTVGSDERNHHQSNVFTTRDNVKLYKTPNFTEI